jgi:hypothetical protein
MSWTLGPLTIGRHTYGRNVIRYAGGGTGTATLTRTSLFTDGRSETVGVSGAVSIDAAVPDVWIDGDVPFGAKVARITYKIGVTTLVVPVEVRTNSVISDPFTGLSVNVIGAEIGDRSWHSATSASWLEVTVWGDPLINARPEQAPTQAFSVYTTTERDRASLATLCGSRRSLLLRTPDLGMPDAWFVLLGERVEQRLVQTADEVWRRHAWSAQTLARPSTARAHAGETLATLAAEVPGTLADIQTRWATLGAIAAAVITPEVAVAP